MHSVPESHTANDVVEYDDSEWTREELEVLAWVVGKEAGWEEMDEYDDEA
jgi:hypothetical protein